MAFFDGNQQWATTAGTPLPLLLSGFIYNGTSGMDVIYGSDPQTRQRPNGSSDVLLGHDTLSGSDEADGILGRGGNDSISGGGGNDGLYGDDGNDVINGNQGEDLISGDAGNDTLAGGQNNDNLAGGTGNDLMFGDLGDDYLQGNSGADTLYGGEANDTVLGGQNNDVLYGGAGNDVLTGDLGNDTLYGEGGADQFLAVNTNGYDVVQDFNYAEGDRVRIAAGTTGTAYQSGADTHFDMGGGNVLVLANVNLASLPSDWAFY
jgi:serralysin